MPNSEGGNLLQAERPEHHDGSKDSKKRYSEKESSRSSNPGPASLGRKLRPSEELTYPRPYCESETKAKLGGCMTKKKMKSPDGLPSICHIPRGCSPREGLPGQDTHKHKTSKTAIKPRNRSTALTSAGSSQQASLVCPRRSAEGHEGHETRSAGKREGKGGPALTKVQPIYAMPFLPFVLPNGELMWPSMSPPRVPLVKADEGT